jgi:D-alanyl-D-alanine dipeptidase
MLPAVARGRAPIALLVACALLPSPRPAGASPPSELVDLTRIAPHVRLDIRYATANNFTHHQVYPDARCLLRRGVAERLARVQAALEADGLGLQVFDCFRPLSVQRKFWALVPDPRYVADPRKGSRHNRGAAVDLTLVTAAGAPLDMGTDFDDFSERAHRDYRALPDAALAHRAQLERAMAREGFVGLPTEWWHFDAPDWRTFAIEE